jgi:hypothetical protein
MWNWSRRVCPAIETGGTLSEFHLSSSGGVVRLFRGVFVIAVLLGATAIIDHGGQVAQAQGPRRDGRWEVTMQMEMPGMPVPLPPQTTTQCITPEQANNPQQSVPQAGRGQVGDCKVADYKIDGNKVSWTMKCEGREPMTGTGEMIYAGETYKGTIKVSARGQNVTMTYSGKRLGDCTAGR